MTAAVPLPKEKKKWGWAVPALMLLCLALRLPGLMALPIFGDESIYLRWAQLIRGVGGDGGHHWWVSLQDPKPPLHFWLIALVWNWTSDPLMSARLISVAAGVICVPLTVWIVDELGYLVNRQVPAGGVTLGPRGVGLIAAVLMSVCPFLAFYQRLATQDALFTMESMGVVWLSLRWARTVNDSARRGGSLWAVLLGTAIGAGLMTRQGVSYTVCAFPFVAWFAHRMAVRLESPQRVPWEGALLQLFLAGVVAGVIWLPYLMVKPSEESAPELKRRIFYQDSFVGGPGERLNIASRNIRLTFVPNWIGGDPHEPNSGWLYLYMTPPLYGLGIAGLAYLAFRRPWVFALLLVWLVLLIGPLLFLANTIYSRYVLAGTPPMLIGAAFLLGDVTVMFAAAIPRRPVYGIGIASVLWVFVLILPLRELATQAFDWPSQTLTLHGEARSDRYQYITGWTAGAATRDALAYLQQAVATGPLVIITTNGWGTPADALWVYFDGKPNTQVFYVDGDRVAEPASEAGYYLLKSNKWLYPPSAAQPVKFPEGARVFFVTNDPVHAATDVPAASFYLQGNPNLGTPQTFYGVEGRMGEGVSVFPVSTTGPAPRGRGG